MHSMFSRVVKFAAVAAVCGFAAVALAETTADYVQDGLVAMWDAFENVGPGLHEDAPAEWIDVVGGAKLTVGEKEGFDGCEFILDALVHKSDIALFGTFTNITIEVNGRPTWCAAAGNWNAPFAEIPNIGGFGWDGRKGAISIYRVDKAKTNQLHYISYNSGYSTIASLVNANLNQTYSALLGMDTSSVYVNGESRGKPSGGLDWTGNTRLSSLFFQTGSGQTKSRICNIRIYAGHLTSAQIQANRAVDAARFDNGRYGIHATLTGGIFEYDGEVHTAELTVTDPTEGVTSEWSVDGGEYVSAQPDIVDPGVHTVQCRLTADGRPTRVLTTQVIVFNHAAKISAGSVRADAGTLTNFVALVRLSEDLTPGFKSADAAEGGADVRFFDLDGHRLAHEIDTWATDTNPAGTNLVWVLLPLMNSATVFYATWGYGAGAAMDAYEPTKVWGEYVAVWHLNEASGTAYDSTGHGLDAVVSETYAETSVATNDTPFGGAARVTPQEHAVLTAPDYTASDYAGKVKLPDAFLYVSGWYNPSYVGNKTYPSFWFKRSGEVGYGCNFQDNSTQITVVGNARGWGTHTGLGDLTKVGWIRVAAVYLVGNYDFFYMNGAYVGGKETTSIGDTTGIPVKIGGVKGLFDEVRIKWAGPDRVAGSGKASSTPVGRIERAEYDQAVNPIFYSQVGVGDRSSKIANAVTGSAVQRTVTVNGAMSAIGEGETTVQLVCGGVLVGEPMAVTEIGPFSLVVDVSAYVGFDTNSVFAVQMVNGGKTETTGTVEVMPIDKATYVWTQGGADNEWTNAANWVTSPAHDRKAYPQANIVTAKFMPCAEGQRWSVHLGRSITVKTLDMSGGNVRADFSSEGVTAALTIGPGDANLMSGTSNVVTFSDMNVNYTTTKSAGGNCYLHGQLTFVRSKLECWEWADVYFMEKVTFKDSALNIYSTSLHLNSDLVIDNSQINKTGVFLPVGTHGASGDTGIVTFRGENPSLVCSRVTTWYTDATHFGRFVFEVPEGGFKTQPVVNVTDSGSKVFNNSAQTTIEVDPASPIFAANLKEPLTQHLISAPAGCNSAVITLGDLPKRNVRAGSAFYWMEKGVRYEEKADTRTALYVTIATPRSGMQVLVK